MNHCPKCRAATLRPLQTASTIAGLAGLPQRCSRCRGFWVRLASIKALQESGVLTSVDDNTERSEADRRTGLCPEGHGILARAKASWTRPFFVERCMVCSRIWLDAGEWKRLTAEHLIEHLDDLWLPTWRKQMQQQHSASRLQEIVVERLGPDLLRRIDELATELAAHEHPQLGMAVLREKFELKRPRRSRK